MEILLHNLAWTIGLEFPIYWFFLRKEPFWQASLFIISLNLFTLPLAMIAYHRLDIHLIPVEIGVSVVEGIVCAIFWKRKWYISLLVALLANIFSQGFYLVFIA